MRKKESRSIRRNKKVYIKMQKATIMRTKEQEKMKGLFLLLVLGGSLGLCCSSDLLHSVLSLFALLPASLFNLGGIFVSDKSVVWLELLQGI